MSSEYPTVDGKFSQVRVLVSGEWDIRCCDETPLSLPSQVCYLKAVDDCYLGTMSKLTRQSKRHTFLSLDTAFDYMCFHSPYNKLVQQSFRRMLFLDAHRLRQGGHPLPSALEALESFAGLPLSDTYQNRDLDKALQVRARTVVWGVTPSSSARVNPCVSFCSQSCGNDAYRRMVGPSEEFSKNIGNSYTAAVWANLLCLADAKGKDLEGAVWDVWLLVGVGTPARRRADPRSPPPPPLPCRSHVAAGKRIGVFSYGSGAIATLLTLEGATEPPGSPFTLQRIHSVVGLHKRLAARTEATPAEFVDALRMRESTYGTSSFTPHGSLDNVGKGVWYLKEVTAQGTRVYDRK
jgi:hydroxymethylglutaryl-CoA synthase